MDGVVRVTDFELKWLGTSVQRLEVVINDLGLVTANHIKRHRLLQLIVQHFDIMQEVLLHQ